ncbi:MAG: hypothetical protein V4548_06720 [Bacteroidota bacterium]
MKFKFSYFLLLFCLASSITLVSCKNNDDPTLTENTKDIKKRELVFSDINTSWTFTATPINPASSELVGQWAEWAGFLKELGQKPKSSIGAFQQKAKTLSTKVLELNNNIPATYNKPEIKSRIAVLTTKINSLNLYINLDEIPAQKVIQLIKEIKIELISLQSQMSEIVRKKSIPKEEGESDIIKIRDTSRAIPTKPIKIN